MLLAGRTLDGAALETRRSSREVLEVVKRSTNTKMKSIGEMNVRSETRFLVCDLSF
jgi:hypothetical protein